MASQSISEVISALDTIVKESMAKDDRNGYFAALYKQVTMAVAEKIRNGYFDDNERMERLDVVFANRYLDAWQQYKEGKPCTFCWQLAFDAAKEWKPMVIHHLVAGMNAHIGLDLGIAAATIAPGQQISAVHNDFQKINAVLNSLMDEVKKDLFDMWPASRMLANLRREKLENELGAFSMEVARDAAWQVALSYATLQTPEQKTQFILKRDEKVTAFGRRILYPGKFFSAILSVLRLFETGSISSKIQKLNERGNQEG